MRWPNTSGLPAQWMMRFTQSLVCMVRTLLCLNFFDGFVGEMKHINKIGYPWLAHVNTWCDGSASRKWAWWSKDRILGHAVFFTWIFMCPNFILVFLVFNTPVSTYFCLQHFSVQFIGWLLSNLYWEMMPYEYDS